MEILVLGGEGMLGHKMFQTLGQRFPEVGCTIRGSLADPAFQRIDLFQGAEVIENFDATRFESLEALLRLHRPEVVANCIGIVIQAEETRSAVLNIGLNAYLPHLLAEVLSEWGGRLYHFSTDCVFTGHQGRYTEDDFADADDLYGRSKYLGEVRQAPNALTLRTSIIGRELFRFKSLLEWFLSQNHKSIQGWTKAIYAGVTTNYIAQTVARLIVEYPDLSGLYQVTSTPISKYDLLLLLREAYHLDIEIVPADGRNEDKSMVGEKFVAATGYVCPPWPELVTQLAQDPTPYEEWR